VLVKIWLQATLAISLASGGWYQDGLAKEGAQHPKEKGRKGRATVD